MELVYVICSLATAGLCEEHRAAVYSPSPLACVMGAPPELAQLAPANWRVARWRCDAGADAPAPRVVVVAAD